MEYLPWAILALVMYSFIAPLVSYVTEEVPASVGLFLSTAIFLVITSIVLLVTQTADPAYATMPSAMYIYVAGVFLTVGVLAYITALEAGPVSVVVPIYGMFIVGSSVIGILFLGESLTARRVAGIGCAVIAIVLGAGEGT